MNNNKKLKNKLTVEKKYYIISTRNIFRKSNSVYKNMNRSMAGEKKDISNRKL